MKSFLQSRATALHKRLHKVLLAELRKSYVGHLNKCLQRVLFQMLLIMVVQEKSTASWEAATEMSGVKEEQKRKQFETITLIAWNRFHNSPPKKPISISNSNST